MNWRRHAIAAALAITSGVLLAGLILQAERSVIAGVSAACAAKP